MTSLHRAQTARLGFYPRSERSCFKPYSKTNQSIIVSLLITYKLTEETNTRKESSKSDDVGQLNEGDTHKGTEASIPTSPGNSFKLRKRARDTCYSAQHPIQCGWHNQTVVIWYG